MFNNEEVIALLNTIDTFVWGPPLLVLLVGTGIWLTIRLKLLQVFKLGDALKLIFFAKNDGHGDVNSFKALCTALAATVGTGNIVGVATAIKAGGPGALFWMWMAAFFGMATKYAECLLAVKYRTVDANGNISGGPMYYIEKGMGKKYRPLANFVCCVWRFMCLLWHWYLCTGKFHCRNYADYRRHTCNLHRHCHHRSGCSNYYRRFAEHCKRSL